MMEFILLKISPIATNLISVGAVIVLFTAFYIYQYRRFRKIYSSSRLYLALKEKDLINQLFDNMPDRIYFKDRESRFLIANKFVAAIMGQKDPEILIGKTDYDFYDAKYADSYFKDEQRIMKEGKPMLGKEERGLSIDGAEVHVSTSKIPIRDSNNKVIGIIGIGRDITLQKEAEEELKIKTEHLKETNVLLEERQEEIQQMSEELNAQAENLKIINKELERISVVASKTENAVIITDSNGNFEWVNEGFEKKYSISFESLTKGTPVNIRENSSYDNISAILNQIYITKKPFTYNSKYLDKTGKTNWSQTNITPLLNEEKEITNLILIDSDITDIKNAESQIHAQKAEMEEIAIELGETNATKDRLFSIIAHDLKNPFHSILGFTNILLKKYKDIEREKLKEFLGMIEDSSTSAYQLLENLLEWARTQTNSVKIKPENVNIHTIVEEIISLQSLHASNKSISLNNEVDENLTAYTDSNMLNTVIRNLSSNSIKFTNEGGMITISASSDEDNVTIRITDNGVGIPEDVLKTLFQLDKVQSSAGTSGEGGTGLGLVVCSEFMKLNNGTISAESKLGQGSIFSLVLPVKSTN